MTSHPAANCDPLGRFRPSRASAWLHVPSIPGGSLRRAGLFVTHLAIDACCARCQHGINDVLGTGRSINGQTRGSPKMEFHFAGSSHSSGWLQERQRWGRLLGADRTLLTGHNHRVSSWGSNPSPATSGPGPAGNVERILACCWQGIALRPPKLGLDASGHPSAIGASDLPRLDGRSHEAVHAMLRDFSLISPCRLYAGIGGASPA